MKYIQVVQVFSLESTVVDLLFLELVYIFQIF
jgi:hypothetical protein